MSKQTQTAVELLVEKIFGSHTKEWQKEIDQALQMEKEQIKEAFRSGIEYWNGDEWQLIDIEQYYTETYGSK